MDRLKPRARRSRSGLPEWHRRHYFHATNIGKPEHQPRLVPVQDLEASAQIAETEAGVGHREILRNVRAIVVDSQAKSTLMARTGHPDFAARDALGDTVLDGVLNE